MEGRSLGEERVWTAGLAVIGDEILSGRTQDRNIAQIATWLNVQGIRLAEVRVVPDIEERIVEAVTRLLTDRVAYRMMARAVNPYGDGHAAERAVLAIEHFFGYAKRPVEFGTKVRAPSLQPETLLPAAVAAQAGSGRRKVVYGSRAKTPASAQA